MRGKVRRLEPAKGYGFIEGEDGLSRFVHCRDVDPPWAFELLKEGCPVEFTSVDTGDKTRGNGLKAVQVRQC